MQEKKPLAPILIVILAIAISLLLIPEETKKKYVRNPFGEMASLSEVKVPILMYHYVEYNQDKKDYLRDQQNVPPHVFEQQIVDLKKAGFTFITPKELPKVMENPIDKYVILSFDDGFRDFYTDAYPILKKHNIPAINYVVFNFMGGQDYMTKEMIREIANDGLIEIGSHTLNHASLPGLDDATLESEVSLSKAFLEKEFGIEVVSFAYPYGSHDERSIKAAKKAGYTTAVTVESGNIAKPTELFTLPRIRPGHAGGEFLIDYINR